MPFCESVSYGALTNDSVYVSGASDRKWKVPPASVVVVTTCDGALAVTRTPAIAACDCASTTLPETAPVVPAIATDGRNDATKTVARIDFNQRIYESIPKATACPLWLFHPVPREEKPERESGIFSVACEGPADGRIGRPLLSGEAEMGWARPGVEDEQAMPPEQLHDVSRAVRADTRQREKHILRLLVGIALGLRQRFEVELSANDVVRNAPHVWAPIAHARDLSIPRCGSLSQQRGLGESAAAKLYERSRHADRRRPRAVCRADRLDDVFEHGWACKNASGAGARPPEHFIAGDLCVKGCEIVVKAKHLSDDRAHAFGVATCQPRRRPHN